MKARTTSSQIFIDEMEPTKINAPTVCGNNQKWCESCVSKGKCASTSPSKIGRESGEKFGKNFERGLKYGTEPEGKVMNVGIINKHTHLGEHEAKANILLSATVDDVFSITLEDEDNGVKSRWEMTMHRDAAEKVARKFAEMLGIIPIERKRE